MTGKCTHADYLADMLEACTLAQQFVDGVTFDEFQRNIEKLFAVTRALEVIGEAAAHVPPAVQAQRPDVPWSALSACAMC